jgi:VIT1/CCC1 family predicted Fe2+/Mn2+ transporter
MDPITLLIVIIAVLLLAGALYGRSIDVPGMISNVLWVLLLIVLVILALRAFGYGGPVGSTWSTKPAASTWSTHHG